MVTAAVGFAGVVIGFVGALYVFARYAPKKP